MNILDLSERLRAETHTLHRQVERSAFMVALLGGLLDKFSYCLLLRNLEPIYAELEIGLNQHALHAGIAPIFSPALFRLQALHRDLESLYGAEWRTGLALTSASASYVSRLRVLSESGPERLAAHAYVRYLGDLSGGQMLQKIVMRSLQLPDRHAGTAFYDFGEPADVAKLSQAFRAGLNAMQNDEILIEAKLAFEMHDQLFGELADALRMANRAS